MAERERHSAVIHPRALPGLEVVDLVSGRSFPRHAHDQFGLGVLVRGAQRSWSGRGRVEAAAGDVITSNPGEMHDGAPAGGAARAWRMVYLSPALAAQHLGAGAEIARPVIRDRRLRDAVLTLLARARQDAGADRLAVDEALAHALALVATGYAAQGLKAPATNGGVALARARLDADPAAAVSLDELAGLEGLSPFQLLRSFARELGITPHAYQTQLRIRLARRLLAAGRPPAEVAQTCGFSDQSHLNRAFLRQVGVTPGRYRAALS